MASATVERVDEESCLSRDPNTEVGTESATVERADG